MTYYLLEKLYVKAYITKPRVRMEQKMSLSSTRPEKDGEVLLSTLWLFAALNYIYCDVLGGMDPALVVPFELTPGFLLGAGILLEIPIAMVLLSRVLPKGANRWANIVAGTTMTAVQIASLFLDVPTPYYVFFSVIEIATTLFIVWFAWNWRKPVSQVELNEPKRSASRR